MENKALFNEVQRFRQWWMWVILIICDGTLIGGAWQQWSQEEMFKDRMSDDMGLLFSIGMLLLVNILFLVFRLETSIYDEGIVVRYFPFHLRAREFSWKDISSAEVRTYSPIREYGGWGLRLGLFGRGKAWNVSGDQGLQLVFNNGKKLLIGTQKPEEIREALTERIEK
ncbi:MAG: hypothetical protein GC180_03355 [Bacteroidetes bacterium]|nr:hypothetical protein [Bacteroidota bacterium]